MTKKYTNSEVTVVWKPDMCIHSTVCWKGLIEVFNPKVRPWVNIQAAGTDRIVEQVRKCPSGALSYFMNEDVDVATKPDPVAEAAQVTKVEVTPNGPYILNTQCVILHPDGREEVKEGVVALCRCGASNNKPYCDGRHREVGFQG